MVDKVATHVEQIGSIKAFEAIADRMFGKPIPIEPNTSGRGMERLLEMLAEVRQQRKEWEAQKGAESSVVAIFDVTPTEVTQ